MERLAVAILATGDEVVNGDIIDSNSQAIAQILFEQQIQPGIHMAVDDDQARIADAIQYLLKQHCAVITIGGLGPTSDDRTRFALSEAIGRSLVFDEPTWQAIVKRLTDLKLDIPASNRQQCLFPETARILPNVNGTAAACMIEHQGKWLFMLPGPPSECLPLFEKYVLPALIDFQLAQACHRAHWLLLGVSESAIAENVDALAKSDATLIGYRVNYPYLEVKLSNHDPVEFERLQQQIQQQVAPFLVSRHKQTAIEQLIELVVAKQLQIDIVDQATSGTLHHLLTNAATRNLLHFLAIPAKPGNSLLQLRGLEHIWEDMSQTPYSEFSIHIRHLGDTLTIEKSIANRGSKSRLFAAELACWELLNVLR